MKILYSCLSRSWGGMEMVVITGIKELLKHDIKVELLCLDESRLQIEANNLGIIIHNLKTRSIANPLAVLKTASIIKSGAFDIIHSHASGDMWIIVPALKLLQSRIPLLLTKHVGSYVVKKDFLHNKIYERVDIAIAVSSVIRKNLSETTCLTEDKIAVIFNGVDPGKFDPSKTDRDKIRRELIVGQNEILIGMTARFSPGKGHEEFLLAASILNVKHPELKYIIVGEASRGEDEYAEKIRSLAEKYNLKNLQFLGFRSDIPEVLSAMDVFVFPSRAEAFGIALIEAMAMEKPSVCADSEGVLDIAVDNETSYLFKVKDGNDLAGKLERLVNDGKARQMLGANSRKRVADYFTLEKVTDQAINLYSKIIKDGR